MHGPPKPTSGAAVSHSLTVGGKKTSISLENDFWEALHELARTDRIFVRTLVERIDRDRTTCNLSSAIRLFVLKRYRQIAANTSFTPTSGLSQSPTETNFSDDERH